MEQAFRALLTGSAAIMALVPVTRINWLLAPQGTPRPHVVLTLVDDAEGLTLTGPDGLSQGRVQVDCYADTYAAAKAVANEIRALLHGYRGGSFRLIEHTLTRDTREGGTNEADRPYRCGLDFLTTWRP